MTGHPDALSMFLVGLAIVGSALARAACGQIGVPPLVGFVLMGVGLGAADDRWNLFGETDATVFGFLADLGIVALLFRVGLESNLRALLAKLRQASVIWLGNVVGAGGLGFVAAYAIADLELAPALVVATALTATSVGVAAAVWHDAGALRSATGSLLVDVAELDDVSAVLLMALVFALVPALTTGSGMPWLAAIGRVGTLLLHLGVFVGLAAAVAALVEPRLTRLTAPRGQPAQRMATVAGIGIVVATLAAWLGFSLAIGALFAGLAFSRDPEAVRAETRLADLHALFVPFFFIEIGRHVDVSALNPGVAGTGIVLVGAAIAGKIVGVFPAAALVSGRHAGVLITLSMLPRAEIAMVIIETGRAMGPGVVPDRAFAAMVLVVVTTCLMTPWLLARGLRRLPHASPRRPAL